MIFGVNATDTAAAETVGDEGVQGFTGRSVAIVVALTALALQVVALVVWSATDGYCDPRPTGLVWSHGPVADGLTLAGGFGAPVAALIALPFLLRRRPGRRGPLIAARIAVALSPVLAYAILGTLFSESFLTC